MGKKEGLGVGKAVGESVGELVGQELVLRHVKNPAMIKRKFERRDQKGIRIAKTNQK